MEQVFTFVCILTAVLPTLAQQPGKKMTPPPNLGRPYENITTMTMDEIITGAIGGVGVASNLILADENHYLAELDMFLTKEQVISLYQPPSMEEVKKMGKRSVDAEDSHVRRLFDFSEDYSGSGVRTKRKATRDARLRWTNAEIPYLFARGHFDDKEEYLMRRSMTEWERYTCLKFRPATQSDKNSVRFQNGVGCNSQLGMIGGIQSLNLQAPGCRYKGLYLHEIGHAIGLVHEHQLPDRDNYISILYQNVDPNMRIWFNKYTTGQVNQMNVPYEYSSVMHYGITAFSYNGEAQTISAHDKSKEDSIGKVYLKELAYTDVHIVNLMYNCSSHCTNQDQCGSDGHLDQNCRCICRDGSSDCDKSNKKPRDTCVNNYDSWACYIWANQGECERNSHYMNQECAKACGKCGSESTTPAGTCKDIYDPKKCQVWKERGDCVTNERWMKSNCGATCNLCGTTTYGATCTNLHEPSAKCNEWARDGECSVNRQWMFTNCKKACGLCNVTEVETGVEDGGVDEDKMTCENTNPTCEDWATKGECENNPSWMITNCRQACKKCDDGTCKNLYDDIQCQIWAQKAECISNGEWMSKHCAKACGRGACDGTDPVTGTTTVAERRRSTTRPTVVTAATCKNLHSSDTECDIWARSDHCSINPGWMIKNCAKSCKACTGGGSGKVATTTESTDTGKGTSSACRDDNPDCARWGKEGFCDRNPGYNLIYCKKSCNNCNGCRDTNFLCGIWAKNDQCKKNAGYMLRYCQKSCNVCNKSEDEMAKLQPSKDGEPKKLTGDESTNGTGSDRLSTRSGYSMMLFASYIVYRFMN